MYYLLITKDIKFEKLPELTTLLHDTGIVVWHNVPKLREVVIIDPQWLADAMAGVVTFIQQASVSQSGGMVEWNKLQASLSLK
jgi:C-terminal of Roc, COR, domain